MNQTIEQNQATQSYVIQRSDLIKMKKRLARWAIGKGRVLDGLAVYMQIVNDRHQLHEMGGTT